MSAMRNRLFERDPSERERRELTLERNHLCLRASELFYSEARVRDARV